MLETIGIVLVVVALIAVGVFSWKWENSGSDGSEPGEEPYTGYQSSIWKDRRSGQQRRDDPDRSGR